MFVPIKLKNSVDMPLIKSVNSHEYINREHPKCPFCDYEINIIKHELYQLYQDEPNDIECPNCKKDVLVVPEVTYTFNTDEQDY